MPDWPNFYSVTEGRPPRRTLLQALELLEREGPPGFAVDLGCGAGRDTLELLRRGWRVLAIDGEPEALSRLEGHEGLENPALLEMRLARFEDPDLTLPPCDLVNASFSLPFCPAPVFARLWQQIRQALRPGGCFAGHLLGPRDSWANRDGTTAVEERDLDALCAGLQILSREDVEEDSTTERGKAKHWHVYHLVLRKPARRDNGPDEGTPGR